MKIEQPLSQESFLAYYLSDSMARLPVRAATLPANNKSDPNFETKTFGLFSTCEKSMRAGFVKRSMEHLFFITNWQGKRQLTGYYHVRWFCHSATPQPNDLCLAADFVKFFSPVALDTLPVPAAEETSMRFRNYKKLTAKATTVLLNTVRALPDITDAYFAELDRLERFCYYRTGFRYPSWQKKERFDWECARQYISLAGGPKRIVKTKNTAPGDLWICGKCSNVLKNKALLKMCPACKSVGTFRPRNEV